MKDLEPIKHIEVKELYLDGNPLCANYDELSYVHCIREINPKIEKLVSS